jgi:hypothetical protein
MTLRMLQGNAGGGGASFLMPLVFDGIVNAGATPFQVREACTATCCSACKAQQCCVDVALHSPPPCDTVWVCFNVAHSYTIFAAHL